MGGGGRSKCSRSQLYHSEACFSTSHPPWMVVLYNVTLLSWFSGGFRKQRRKEGELCRVPPSSQSPVGMRQNLVCTWLDEGLHRGTSHAFPRRCWQEPQTGSEETRAQAFILPLNLVAIPEVPLNSSSPTNPTHPALCSLATNQAATPWVGSGTVPGHTLVK